MLVHDGIVRSMYVHDDEAFVLAVRNTGTFSESGNPQWQYDILKDGEVLASGDDLFGWNTSRGMLGGFVSLLLDEAEQYDKFRFMQSIQDGEEPYRFGEEVADWACMVSDELWYLGMLLGPTLD